MPAKNIAVFGIYRDRDGVENAIDSLRSADFRNTDISVLFPENVGSKEFAIQKGTKAPEGVATGATSGAVVGGALGWLAGIGALAIPGIGPLLAAGPLVAALAGAGVGGALGGLTGALVGMGMPEYEAKRYEGRIKKGGILLSIHCDNSEWSKRAKDILVSTGADDIATAGEAKAEYDKSDKPLPRARKRARSSETLGSTSPAIAKTEQRRAEGSVKSIHYQPTTSGGLMAETDDVIDVLENLIETCRDGENGYRQAAENVKNPELAAFFRSQSSQRAQFAQELESEAARLGKTEPKREGSVAGALHRTWFDLKEKLGGGDKAILESAEKGEDSAKEAYEEALAEENVTAELRVVIRRQADNIFAAHDEVRALRDAAKAA